MASTALQIVMGVALVILLFAVGEITGLLRPRIKETFSRLPFGSWEGPVPDPVQAKYWEETELTYGTGKAQPPLRFTRRGDGRFDTDPTNGNFQAQLSFNKMGGGTFKSSGDPRYNKEYVGSVDPLDPQVADIPLDTPDDLHTIWDGSQTKDFQLKSYMDEAKAKGEKMTPMAAILNEQEPFAVEHLSLKDVAKEADKAADKAKDKAKDAAKSTEKGLKKGLKETEKGLKKAVDKIEDVAKKANPMNAIMGLVKPAAAIGALALLVL